MLDSLVCSTCFFGYTSGDAVAEHLFTPTQRTPEPPATPPVRRGSSSHIESPASPPGKLQREASASILCRRESWFWMEDVDVRQASELKKDSSQAQMAFFGRPKGGFAGAALPGEQRLLPGS